MEYPLFLPKAVYFEMTTTKARTTAVVAAAAVAAVTAVLTTTITMSICIIEFGRGGTQIRWYMQMCQRHQSW